MALPPPFSFKWANWSQIRYFALGAHRCRKEVGANGFEPSNRLVPNHRKKSISRRFGATYKVPTTLQLANCPTSVTFQKPPACEVSAKASTCSLLPVVVRAASRIVSVTFPKSCLPASFGSALAAHAVVAVSLPERFPAALRDLCKKFDRVAARCRALI